jgi:PadR family transcriptional regulator PadR
VFFKRFAKGLFRISGHFQRLYFPIPCRSRYYTFIYEVYVGSRGNTGFIAGLPELLILRLLQDQEMYGYEIVQAIARRTGGAVAPGEGVVYPLLRALETDGDLRSRTAPAGGRTRVYYTLTSKGVRLLFDQTDQWMRIAKTVQQALRPG